MTEIINQEIIVEISQVQNTIDITSDKIINIYSGGNWGEIIGNIENQLDLQAALDNIDNSINAAIALLNDAIALKQDLLEKGVANGYASLDETGKVPQDQLAIEPQINSDWEADSGVALILNKPNLAEVATSGSYEDLEDKPNIPSISGLLIDNNNLSDLTNPTTARANLELGSLATQNGTFSGTSSGTNTGDETNTSIITKIGYVPFNAATDPLPNCVIKNGIAYFNQPTNPTTRIINGVASPLVIGDRNYRTDLNTDTFWNGTYWVKPSKGIYGSFTFVNTTENFVNQVGSFIGDSPDSAYVLKELRVTYYRTYPDNIPFSPLHSSDNYFTIDIVVRGTRGAGAAGGSVYPNNGFILPLNGVSYPLPSASKNTLIFPINQVYQWADLATTTARATRHGSTQIYLDAAYSLITHSIV